jgi:NADPH:quinone reductase-like Zn-dependent oxidoreductase
MHAITLKSFGDPSVLTVSQMPQPLPAPDDLLIKVAAAALNRADLLQRRGHYPPPRGASDILGMEIAGEIVGMGTNVTGFGIGEKVFGLVGGGGYSEYCLLDQGMGPTPPAKFKLYRSRRHRRSFYDCTGSSIHPGLFTTP